MSSKKNTVIKKKDTIHADGIDIAVYTSNVSY